MTEATQHPPCVQQNQSAGASSPPGGLRITLQYTLALLLLALLQAPTLANKLEDFGGEFPAAGKAAIFLQTLGEKSGASAAGEYVSGGLTRLSPVLYLGAMEEVRDKSGPPSSFSGRPSETTPKLPESRAQEAISLTLEEYQNERPAAYAAPLWDGSWAPFAGVAADAHGQNGTARTTAKAHSETAASSADIEAKTEGQTTPSSADNGAKAEGETKAEAAAKADSGAETGKDAIADAAAETIGEPKTGEERNKPLALLIGDSMMMEGLGPALLRSLHGRDDINAVREAKYSTGLSRKDYFDWPAHMAELVEKHSPDVVIITMGGNDAQDIVDDAKKRHFVGSKSWEEQYRLRASLLVRAAQAKGADVIWVGLPVMGQPTHARHSLQLAAQQEAACSENSPCVYVDTLPLLADKNGEFISFVQGNSGKQIRIRYKDKIHVTTAGGELLVAKVLPQLEKILQSRASVKEKTPVDDGVQAEDTQSPPRKEAAAVFDGARTASAPGGVRTAPD